MGHCQGLLGWDIEFDSGGCRVESVGGRSFVHADVLHLCQTLALGTGSLSF